MALEVSIGRGLVTVIDNEDYPFVSRHRWVALERNTKEPSWFAGRAGSVRGVKRSLYLHRLLVGAATGETVDHIDGDTLNNRRANLRIRPLGAPKLSPRELVAKYAVQCASGCWEWQGCLDRYGYGRVTIGGAVTAAYRMAYEAHVGPIPNGLEIDHLCRNPRCVNPEHLEPVTAAENLRRARVARQVAGASRKGPLRKIITIHNPRRGAFDSARVELECGHTVSAWGSKRARCDKCSTLQPEQAK